MSESRGRDLKPPVDDIFYEIFGFWTFFRYHNFQNEIDAWESTVLYDYLFAVSTTVWIKIRICDQDHEFDGMLSWFDID